MALNLSEGLAALIAVVIMLAKGYPADDETLKTVVVEMAVAIPTGTSRDAQWMLGTRPLVRAAPTINP